MWHYASLHICVDNTFKGWHLLITDAASASCCGGERVLCLIYIFYHSSLLLPTWAVIRPVQQGNLCSASPADVMIEGFKNILHMPPKYVAEDLLISHNHHINQWFHCSGSTFYLFHCIPLLPYGSFQVRPLQHITISISFFQLQKQEIWFHSL